MTPYQIKHSQSTHNTHTISHILYLTSNILHLITHAIQKLRKTEQAFGSGRLRDIRIQRTDAETADFQTKH